MTVDIIALEAAAAFWDSVSVWSAIAVFLGVGAECVAEFEALSRLARLTGARRKSIASQAGLLLLVGALAVEVVAAIGSHNTNQQIVSILNNELNATITHLEQIQAKQAPWDFSQSQRDKFAAIMNLTQRGKIVIEYSNSDGTRGSEFADALNRVLKNDLNFDVWGYVGGFTSSGPTPLVGVQLSIKKESSRALENAIRDAFRAIGIEAREAKRSPDDGTYEDDAVVISIGIKAT